jgi:uncharacterized Ntn-hydrolase superfamily protein
MPAESQSRSRRHLAAAACVLLLLADVAQPTYSIVVVDAATGEVGIACVSCRPGGIDLAQSIPVLLVGKGGGVIQARSDQTGVLLQGLRHALEIGAAPLDVLRELLASDPFVSERQIGLVDRLHEPAVFSGPDVNPAWANVTGTIGTLRYSLQGNALAGAAVVAQGEYGLRASRGDLGQRLLAALEAMRAMGGDGRCSCDPLEPYSCGTPPPGFTKSGHTGFVLVARTGDLDGGCSKASGCADGSYYLDIRFPGDVGDPDPVLVLEAYYDSWRAALSGRPDHHLSTVEMSAEALPADGWSTATLRIRLVDVDSRPLAHGGATVHLTRLSGSSTVAAPAVDHGDGTYSVELTAGLLPGVDSWQVVVDDGGRPVTLVHPATLRVDPLTMLHAGFQSISVASPTSVPFTLNLDAKYKGKKYHLLASASGATPGIVFEGVHLPLNPDVLFTLTKDSPNTSILPNTKSQLDGLGRAKAAFVGTPLLLTPLIGHRIEWSGVIFDKKKFALEPVGFDVVP